MVDSSFFWGYLITQIPGGFLASFLPANRIFGVAIITSALLNMLVPGAMSLDTVWVLVCIRVLQGLVEVRFFKVVERIRNEMIGMSLFFFVLGCCVSSLSRYLALLGTTTRTFSSGNHRVLWFICWNRNRNASIWIFGTIHQLAGTILFLFNLWHLLVYGMALVSF